MPTFRFRKIPDDKTVVGAVAWGVIPSAFDPEAATANEASLVAPASFPSAALAGDPARAITAWTNWIGRIFDSNHAPIVSLGTKRLRGARLALIGEGHIVSVEELFSFVAYCMGGIHPLDDADKPYKRAILKSVGRTITDYGHGDPQDEILTVLQVVSLVVVRGLADLYRELKDRPRLLSWWPHSK